LRERGAGIFDPPSDKGSSDGESIPPPWRNTVVRLALGQFQLLHDPAKTEMVTVTISLPLAT
jgi:hypothetical protein